MWLCCGWLKEEHAGEKQSKRDNMTSMLDGSCCGVVDSQSILCALGGFAIFVNSCVWGALCATETDIKPWYRPSLKIIRVSCIARLIRMYGYIDVTLHVFQPTRHTKGPFLLCHLLLGERAVERLHLLARFISAH